MAIIITITAKIGTIDNNFYNYSNEDRILKNIINGNYEVFYSGQNQGILDYKLINAVNTSETFRIYYREKSNLPFIFLGTTNCSSIIKERTVEIGINSQPNERLQIKLLISLNNINNTVIDTDFDGVGKYKKAILHHSGFDTNVNINLGFYTNM